MITEFKNEQHEITADEYSKENLTLAMLSLSEFTAYSAKLNIPADLTSMPADDLDYTEDGFVISLRKISTAVEKTYEKNIYVFINSKLLAVVDSDDETKEHFLRNLSFGRHGYSIEKLTANYLSSLTYRDSRELDEIENIISKFEDSVLTGGKTENINTEILKIKRKLLRLRCFYEQLSEIADMLIKNENGVLNGKKMKYIRDFSADMEKLISKVDMLRESLVQLREAYQASLDLKLNNTMKLFTVIATIFLPLTLITSWYGMNFRYMPELGWKYGYVYVIVLSIVVAVGCIIYFKKKKLM